MIKKEIKGQEHVMLIDAVLLWFCDVMYELVRFDIKYVYISQNGAKTDKICKTEKIACPKGLLKDH